MTVAGNPEAVQPSLGVDLVARSRARPVLAVGDGGRGEDLDAIDSAACALLRRYQAEPDRDTLARLFEMTRAQLEVVAAGVAARVGRRGEEEDLLQGFLVKLVAGRLPPGGSLRSFFAFANTAMRNDALSVLRRAGREARRHQLYEQARPAPADPAAIAEHGEQVGEWPRVWALVLGVAGAALDQLKARDQRALVLRSVDGLACADVARRLGVKAGQGGMVVKRARDRYLDRLQGVFDAGALRRRLADLTYETVKAHLLRDPESALRIEQQQSPRQLDVLRRALQEVDAGETSARHWRRGRSWAPLAGNRRAALAAVRDGLEALERLEGRSARWGLVTANLLIQQQRCGEARELLGQVARGDRDGRFLPLTLGNVARAFNGEGRFGDVDMVVRHADADDARFALLAYNHSVALARSGRTAAFLESCGRLARWVAGGRATAVERMIRADLDHTADALGLGRGVVAAAYGLT